MNSLNPYLPPSEGVKPKKIESLERHTELADIILRHFRQYQGFRNAADEVMPIPGFSNAVLQLVGDQHAIVVGVSPREDGITLQVGLTMSGIDTETFTELKFHPMSAGNLYMRKPLIVNAYDVDKDGLEKILSPLIPVLEEGRKLLQEAPPDATRIGYFPQIEAQRFKIWNKITRIGGMCGGNLLTITALFAAAGAALGPEHLSNILQQIPDEFLTQWLREAKNELPSYIAQVSHYSGSNEIWDRRVSGFILFLEGMRVSLVMVPVSAAIHECLRRKPKYIDDL